FFMPSQSPSCPDAIVVLGCPFEKPRIDRAVSLQVSLCEAFEPGLSGIGQENDPIESVLYLFAPGHHGS
ncbi:hypothetical protein, partial [Halomonas sp. ND22Bw]|uniref:hypothetical protein n=1 Tax=Halomonas sp. ND22Bw TaxID=2054178 RepID=UPI001C62F209